MVVMVYFKMSVHLKGVTVYYGEETQPAIKNISFDVEKGQMVGFFGPNGSGKSTLFHTLNGIIPYVVPGRVEGEQIVDGLDARKYGIRDLTRHVGLVLPDPDVSLVAITVEDDVAFGPQCLGLSTEEIQKRVTESLNTFRLVGYDKRTTHTLSGGEEQSLAIAGIYAMRPPIFALDEPICMLDPIGKDTVLKVISRLNKELGMTVLISEAGGDIEYIAPMCDRMVLLKDGTIIADGPTREILADRELLRSIRILPPQVTEIALRLGIKDPKSMPITIEEGMACIASILKNKKIELSAERRVLAPAHEKRVPIITVRNLYHTFTGMRPVYALRDINLDIYEGEMVGLIGQNGSGKTTLALHLVGIHKPTNPNGSVKPLPNAKIIVDGCDVTKATVREVVNHINYAFQNPDYQLFMETVEEEISYACNMFELGAEETKKRVDWVMDLYKLQNDRKAPIYNATKDKKTFVAQASILVMRPKVLIIDEPTTGLDYEMGQKVLRILRKLNREEGKTIIIITHNQKLVAEYTDRTIVMKQGQILMDGPTREVYSKPEILRESFLEPPEVTRVGQGLKDYGFPPDVMTIDEMLDLLKGR